MSNKKPQSLITFLIIGIATLFIASLFATALTQVQVTISSSGSISNQNGPSTQGLPNANYYVIAYNSLYYAFKGGNQQSFLVNANAPYVINYVFGLMRSGQSVVFNGTFQINNQLNLVSNTYLNTINGIFKATSSLTYMFQDSGNTNITINGGSFYGNNLISNFVHTYDASYLNVTNCRLITGFSNGISIALNNDIGDYIYNNTIINNPTSWAIVANNPTSVTITNNYIDSWGDGSGIGLFGSTPYNPSYANNVISDNTIYNWTQGTWHGIYTGGCPNTRVYGNILSSNQTGAGVSFCLKGTAPQYVYNNTIYGSTGHAFMIYKDDPGDSPNGTQIYDNVLYGNGNNLNQDAFYLVGYSTGLENIGDIYISNNTISGFAIALYIVGADSSDWYNNVTFTGNTISNCRIGFSIGYSLTQNSYTANDVITNNTFTNITGGINPGYLGYIAPNVSGTEITGNIAIGTVTTPILIDNGIGTYISGNNPNNWGYPQP